jgi:protoporphyrinogen oxidase
VRPTETGKKVVIVGAGPAGLTAAYELCNASIPSVVIEKDNVVGGISRTINYKGYSFDIGGHRFFTKVEAVDRMWREVLPNGQFLRRDRLSRIYYNKRFFHYPIRASNALFGLGIWNSFLVLLSYVRAQMSPEVPEKTFEQWVSNRFGKRLYRTFFKTYTEKVWGIPCNEITADWAAQRIRGLSLLTAVKNALIRQDSQNKGAVIKTLVDSFDYPAKGPGMMWETVLSLVQSQGCEVHLQTAVHKIRWEPGGVTAIQVHTTEGCQVISGTDFISTMPIRELVQRLEPAAPSEVLNAAERLRYRDFITVALIIKQADVFPDNWIYIHDPSVKVGRIQNFKNWSPQMVPDPGTTCLGLEYFCFEGDQLWTMPDRDLIQLATDELARIGLVDAADVTDGAVVRMPKAYPVYDSQHSEALRIVREFLCRLPNLYLVGRNGMHKYNNQDHSMVTAMLAVRNIIGDHYDIWQVNVDQEYHEQSSTSAERDQFAHLLATQPKVPQRLH